MTLVFKVENNRITSGIDIVDEFLSGGYEKDVITTIYGPAGSGKTTFALIAGIEVAKTKKKVIFLDTEGGFSVERFYQLTNHDEETLKNIYLIKATNFREQSKAILGLNTMINDKIGLIIIDTISMLYRIEIGNTRSIKGTNSELGNQISLLTEIARKHKIPVIITNQVYSDFDERDKVKMVGGDILKYGSKCLIEIDKKDDKRKLILKKHRSCPNRELQFKIINSGIEQDLTPPMVKEEEDIEFRSY